MQSATDIGASTTRGASPCAAVDREIDVALLGLRGDAGRRPGAHHVDQDDRNFGRDREAQCFDHQREARARGDRHGGRAAIGRAERHVDRGEFVLAQHQPAAELEQMRRQPFDQIGRRRDRIAADEAHAAAQRAERERLIAADQPARRRLSGGSSRRSSVKAGARRRRPTRAPLAFAAMSSAPLPAEDIADRRLQPRPRRSQ